VAAADDMEQTCQLIKTQIRNCGCAVSFLRERLGYPRGLIVLELFLAARKTNTPDYSGSALDVYRRHGHDGVLDATEAFSAISQDLNDQCHTNLSFDE
jgi:hypothetical protein